MCCGDFVREVQTEAETLRATSLAEAQKQPRHLFLRYAVALVSYPDDGPLDSGALFIVHPDIHG